MTESAIDLAATGFEDVLDLSSPRFVDFWTGTLWAAQSRTPVFDELADTYARRATISELNVGATAPTWHADVTPTRVVFSGGMISPGMWRAVTRHTARRLGRVVAY